MSTPPPQDPAPNSPPPATRPADEETTRPEQETQSSEKKDTPAKENKDREEGEQDGNDSENEKSELEDGEREEDDDDEEKEEEASAPPLPDEVPPPLPDEAPPGETKDDGWEPVWDGNAQNYYFYNRITGVSQWENPRVPQGGGGGAGGDRPPGVDASAEEDHIPKGPPPVTGGYNPAIHGDYDPTAPYAQQYEQAPETAGHGVDPTQAYAATGAFNRFTGRWQDSSLNPELHNDENKSRRQMNAFFDVDAAANTHDGRSLRAERSAKKLTRNELKMFKEKRREKKEEKRRAWLRD